MHQVPDRVFLNSESTVLFLRRILRNHLLEAVKSELIINLLHYRLVHQQWVRY